MIAAVCPIGFVKGYEDTYRTCIESMAQELDRVYVVLSTRGDGKRFENMPANVQLISDERTWYKQQGGVDQFDFEQIPRNIDIGWDQARQDGAEQLVCLFCNWYVTPGAGAALRQWVNGFGWVYRRESLAGQMFHTDKRMPYVIRADRQVTFLKDGIVFEGRPILWEAQDYSVFDSIAIIDWQLEVTLENYRDRMNFTHCYHELVPKRKPVFDWGFWREYHIRRFRQSLKSDEPPPVMITQPEFISVQVLEAL